MVVAAYSRKTPVMLMVLKVRLAPPAWIMMATGSGMRLIQIVSSVLCHVLNSVPWLTIKGAIPDMDGLGGFEGVMLLAGLDKLKDIKEVLEE